MANTKFMYVRAFEENDACLPNTFMVARLDGRGFTKFCKAHNFEKPNDLRGIQLMNASALEVCKEFPDIFIAYGQSDEYSFCFRRDCQTYGRRRSKLLSTIVSIFSANYVLKWSEYMPTQPLLSLPVFDGRIVLYPSLDNVKDYFRWRQADCHINNMYNTCFWMIVHKQGRTEREAEAELNGTFSKDKHEILFSRFGINYNDLPQSFRKGSVLLRGWEPSTHAQQHHQCRQADEQVEQSEEEGEVARKSRDKSEYSSTAVQENSEKSKSRARRERKWREKQRQKEERGTPQVHHIDIMKDTFWASFEGRL